KSAGVNQWPPLVVPPVSVRMLSGWVGCLTRIKPPISKTTTAISAMTPTLLSSAATLTPAMLNRVTNTMIPAAHAKVSMLESTETPNQPARNGTMLVDTAVTDTVCAMTRSQPVCQASHG